MRRRGGRRDLKVDCRETRRYRHRCLIRRNQRRSFLRRSYMWTYRLRATSRLWPPFAARVGISIYLDTTPVTPQGQGGPIELKNLAKRVTEQLQVAGTDKRSCAALAEQID